MTDVGSPAAPPGAATGDPSRPALGMAVAWAAVLGLLAYLWANSPLSGPGRVFLIWSLPALLLATVTTFWIRRLQLRRLRLGPLAFVAITAAWVGAAVIALTGAGAEWAMDGLILRRRELRLLGVAVQWLPGLFGLALSLAGLAAALEARYRLARRSDAEGPDRLSASGP